MTVKAIGSLPPKLVHPAAVSEFFGFSENWKTPLYGYDGSIDNECWDGSTPGFPGLMSTVKKAGYKRRRCSMYDEVSFTRVQGSAKFHQDHGYGLVVGCLIWHSEVVGSSDNAFSRLYDNEPELITLKNFISVDLGDVFVFNANNYHAWLNNGISVLAQVTISKNK